MLVTLLVTIVVHCIWTGQVAHTVGGIRQACSFLIAVHESIADHRIEQFVAPNAARTGQSDRVGQDLAQQLDRAVVIPTASVHHQEPA